MVAVAMADFPGYMVAKAERKVQCHLHIEALLRAICYYCLVFGIGRFGVFIV